MRVISIVLKVISLIFAGLPLLLLALYWLNGGPSPEIGGLAPAMLIIIGLCILALPNRLLLRSILVVFPYLICSIAATYITLFVARPSCLNIDIRIVYFVITGIVSGVLSLGLEYLSRREQNLRKIKGGGSN